MVNYGIYEVDRETGREILINHYTDLCEAKHDAKFLSGIYGVEYRIYAEELIIEGTNFTTKYLYYKINNGYVDAVGDDSVLYI